MRARDHQVGARRQRVLGQLLVERHVRAPRLVHDQRDAARVRHRQRARLTSATAPKYVGETTHAPTASGVAASARVERLRRSGSGRSRARRPPPAPRTSGAGPTAPASRSCSSARCAAPPRRSPWWASARPAARLPCEAPLIRNHARLAPHASAASRWACSNGRRLDAHVDAVGQRRDVQAQRALAERLQQARVGARAALVPGHVQPCRPPARVRAQRIQVRRLLLALLVTRRSQSVPAVESRRVLNTEAFYQFRLIETRGPG